MRRSLFVSFGAACLLLGAGACKRLDHARLPKAEMQQVLLDVQVAEVYSTMAPRDSAQAAGLSNRDSLAVYYKEIFQHHGITANDFIQSLNWYRAHPDELDSVYQSALRSLDAYSRKPGKGRAE